MKLKKKTKRALKQTTIIALLLCSVFIGISLLSYEKPNTQFHVPNILISDEVQNYRPLVEKYAEQYKVSDYVNVILGMIMQESGGRGKDPMQSSESYCGQRGCIDDPELSIKQGIYYFSQVLEEANGDLELAVQSYNFGRGFIDYVHGETGAYSQKVAIDFSQKMYEKDPNKSKYRCLREESKELEACYGDIYYVQAVMEYRDVLAAE